MAGPIPSHARALISVLDTWISKSKCSMVRLKSPDSCQSALCFASDMVGGAQAPRWLQQCSAG